MRPLSVTGDGVQSVLGPYCMKVPLQTQKEDRVLNLDAWVMR